MKKRVIIAGGSGFMGKALSQHLCHNYEVIVLSRRKDTFLDEVKFSYWDGVHQGDWSRYVDGAFAVINLSGKSVNCRYNEKNKIDILNSRIKSTVAIGLSIQAAANPPQIWMNAASATIYRHSLDKAMDEKEGELGSGFSVEVCKAWEACFYSFSFPNTRQIAMRTAIVLAEKGSVMDYFSALVKLGLGGKMGDGKQMFSWLHIDDFCSIVDWFLLNKDASGTYNLSAPLPVTNDTLMSHLRSKYCQSFGIPLSKSMLEIGAFLLRTETELLLKSRYVLPSRLLEQGYVFKYSTLP